MFFSLARLEDAQQAAAASREAAALSDERAAAAEAASAAAAAAATATAATAATTTTAAPTVTNALNAPDDSILRPRGSGRLQEAMGLDDDDRTYNDIRVSSISPLLFLSILRGS